MLPIVLLFASEAPAKPYKWRASDPALAESLLARGGRRVADYGSFQLIEVDEVALTDVDMGRAELEDEFDVVELNAKPLNTHAPEVRALHKPVGAFAKRRLHLVHFVGPVKPEWRAALEQNGVQVVSYVPQNAYLIYGNVTALCQVQRWAGTNDSVQWEGEYADGYKIHPRARLTDGSGRPQTPATDMFAIQLVDDAEVNTATLALIDRVKLEPIVNRFNLLGYLNVIVRLPPERLSEVAGQPEVVSIQPYFKRHKLDERQDQILAGNLTGGAPSGRGYPGWLASKGFTQAQFMTSGFAVDVSDSGIDNGTTTPGHFGLYPFGDTGWPSRVVYNRIQGRGNPGSTLRGCDGHGTLNAHIIAAYTDWAVDFPHFDAGGFRYGFGVCPFVKLGSSVVFDPDLFTNPNYANLQSRAYHDGARISSNSWGADTAGGYDADAQSYDALVRDAQPSGSTFAAAGNQQMVILFAAGNAGPGTQTADSPGTAKNVITVGAAENVRSLSPANGGNDALGNDGCGTSDSDADNANDMTDFSSRGPCGDGRMKPDLVAPGSHISGGVAQNSPPPSPAGTGSAISCYKSWGVCALVGSGSRGDADNFFPLGQQFYTVSSGTSHSTPAVASACALVRQYFINGGLTPPSPAMIKSYLVNSARYLTGVYASDTLWSPSQGMGEVNLGVAFDGLTRVLRDQLADDKFTATGQTRTFTGSVIDPTKPFRVTLAWTDAPGNTFGYAYNNELDLTVTVGSNTYKGNVFSGAFSATGGVADAKNNVESVFLPAGISGNFTVTITAANINSDGVPNEAPLLDQDFALVIYNAAPPGDLAISKSVAPSAVNLTSNLTFSLYVTNLGPGTAGGVLVADTLPAAMSFVSATVSQGSYSNNGGTVTAVLGGLTNAGAATVNIRAKATIAGLWTNTASVSSSTEDPNNSNNTASAAVFVNSSPTISHIADMASDWNTIVGPLAFTIDDTEMPATALALTVISSNTNLVPRANIVFGGSGSDRTVTITPVTNEFGNVTITVAVSDGMASAGTSFLLTVNPVNHPPTLTAVSDQTITAGMALVITNVAADPDSPPQVLAFSLGLGAPAGANINPTNGLFTWSPTSSQIGTHAFSAVVTDNGLPSSLGATQSFTVIVVLSTNNPPVLAAIPDQIVHALMTVCVTNSAMDPDFLAQMLSFSLETNVAAGAVIDPTNGVFVWMPDDSQLGTNAITVCVTDNGLPPLSDAKTFTVAVFERPALQASISSSNEVTLTWSGIPDWVYRVQFKGGLNETAWTDLAPDVTATGWVAKKTGLMSGDKRRFYRVRVVR